MALFMNFKFVRKLTFPLQLKHLKNSMKDGDIHWYDQIDDRVILGAIPLRKSGAFDPELNIAGVVSLNEPYEDKRTFSIQEWQDMGVECIKYNVPDHVGAASVQQAEEIVDFILRVGVADKKVYVHCKAGKGRSASVVMCYLCQVLDKTPPEVYQYVEERRTQVSLSRKQLDLVDGYHRMARKQ